MRRRFHNELRSPCSSGQISFWTSLTWPILEWLTYFNVSYYERLSDHILYHALFANMVPAVWKINEIESTSLGPHYILWYKVSMLYPNAMKVLNQLVYLGSVGNHLSVITLIWCLLLTALRHLAHPMYWDCHHHINQEWEHWFHHPQMPHSNVEWCGCLVA